MSIYFRLNPECYLVSGAKSCAIYNLITGELVSLDERESNKLSLCETNHPVSKGLFLSRLEEMGFGTFYDRPIYVEKYKSWSSLELVTIWHPPPLLYLAQIQITNKCNLSCSFCKNMWCPDCIRFDGDAKELSPDDWINIIDQLADLECQNLIFTGGEATLYPELDEVLIHAKKRNLNRYIVTNGLNVPEFLREENIILNLFPSTIHLFEKIYENIRHLNKLYLNCIGLKKETAEKLVKHKNIKNIYTKQLNYEPVTKEKLPKTTVDDFNLRLHYDPGLYSRLSITSTGDVIPCFMMTHSLGNLKETKISRCMMGLIEDYWKMNKDKIEKCKKCEFRYACPVCLPALINGDPCTYDPEVGRWL